MSEHDRPRRIRRRRWRPRPPGPAIGDVVRERVESVVDQIWNAFVPKPSAAGVVDRSREEIVDLARDQDGVWKRKENLGT